MDTKDEDTQLSDAGPSNAELELDEKCVELRTRKVHIADLYFKVS
jgi:hypothetical protein